MAAAGLVAGALGPGPSPALADQPVAIVEDVGDSVGKLSAFDYLEAGQRIDLGANGTLTLGYLTSCIREEVEGGQLVVGRRESALTGGSMLREKVRCSTGAADLAQSESQTAGVSTWRAGSDDGPVRVYSQQPVLTFEQAPEHLVLTRQDFPERELKIASPGSRVDLAKQGYSLAPGGRYRVRYGTEERTLVVDPAATWHGALLSRLVAF